MILYVKNICNQLAENVCFPGYLPASKGVGSQVGWTLPMRRLLETHAIGLAPVPHLGVAILADGMDSFGVLRNEQKDLS